MHGLSIPLGKVGYLAPRHINRVLTDEPRTFHVRSKIPIIGGWLDRRMHINEEIDIHNRAEAGVRSGTSRQAEDMPAAHPQRTQKEGLPKSDSQGDGDAGTRTP